MLGRRNLTRADHRNEFAAALRWFGPSGVWSEPRLAAWDLIASFQDFNVDGRQAEIDLLVHVPGRGLVVIDLTNQYFETAAQFEEKLGRSSRQAELLQAALNLKWLRQTHPGLAHGISPDGGMDAKKTPIMPVIPMVACTNKGMSSRKLSKVLNSVPAQANLVHAAIPAEAFNTTNTEAARVLSQALTVDKTRHPRHTPAFNGKAAYNRIHAQGKIPKVVDDVLGKRRGQPGSLVDLVEDLLRETDDTSWSAASDVWDRIQSAAREQGGHSGADPQASATCQARVLQPGLAGSGKTWTAVRGLLTRAVAIPEGGHLLLCSSERLQVFLEGQLVEASDRVPRARRPDAGSFLIRTPEQLAPEATRAAKAEAAERGFPLAEGDRPYRNTERFWRHAAAEVEGFDTILIDEAQDFTADTLEWITRHLLSPTGLAVAFGDRWQTTGAGQLGAGWQVPSGWVVVEALTTNRRCPPPVTAWLKRQAAAGYADPDPLDPRMGAPEVTAEEAMENRLADAIKRSIEERWEQLGRSVLPGEVVVLLPDQQLVSDVRDTVINMGRRLGGVEVMTVDEMKGLEASFVVLVTPTDDGHHPVAIESLLYTGGSRAKVGLHVIGKRS